MVADYLHTFSAELERLRESKNFYATNAIAHDDGALCVLVSAGDVRVKIHFDDFGPDPAKAASEVFKKFKSMTRHEIENAIEEVR